MSQEKWFEEASGFMTDEQREAVARAKAAMPAEADHKAAMDKFNALNARVKAALPLDPASDEAQALLTERDAMLAPFLAAMPAEMKAMSKNLGEKIKQGELAS
jgi:hypothetical protein